LPPPHVLPEPAVSPLPPSAADSVVVAARPDRAAAVLPGASCCVLLPLASSSLAAASLVQSSVDLSSLAAVSATPPVLFHAVPVIVAERLSAAHGLIQTAEAGAVAVR